MANLLEEQTLTREGIDRKLDWFASSVNRKYLQNLFLGLGAGKDNTQSLSLQNRLNSTDYTLSDFAGSNIEEFKANATAGSFVESIDDIDNLQSQELTLDAKNTQEGYWAHQSNFKISLNKLYFYQNRNDLLGASDLILNSFVSALDNHMDVLDKRVYDVYNSSQENYYADIGTLNPPATGNNATISSNAPVNLGNITHVYKLLRKFIDENLLYVNSSSQDWIMKSFLANTMDLSSYEAYDFKQYKEMWSKMMSLARPIMILPYDVFIALNDVVRTEFDSYAYSLLKILDDIPYFVDQKNRIQEEDITLDGGGTTKAVPIYFVSGSPFELFPRENNKKTTHVYLNNGDIVAPNGDFALTVNDVVTGSPASIVETKTSGFSIVTDTSGIIEPNNKKFTIETNFSILPYNNVKKLYIKL